MTAAAIFGFQKIRNFNGQFAVGGDITIFVIFNMVTDAILDFQKFKTFKNGPL